MSNMSLNKIDHDVSARSVETVSDILIIGAGLIGLSTADHLRRRGMSVCVIDAAPGPGQGASHYNSGMIHPSQVRPWLNQQVTPDTLEAVLKLARRSAELLGRQMRDFGIEPIGAPTGCLQIFDHADQSEDALTLYIEHGIKAERYEGEWGLQHFGLFFPGDTMGNAHLYCKALAQDLMSRGVDIRYNMTAALVARNDQVCVKVGSSELKADHIIVAGGAKSAALLSPLGIELPVRPLAGYALNFEKPDCPLPGFPIMHADSHSALTVFEDHVRLSGTVGEETADALIPIWREIFPDLVEALGKPIRQWRGERPGSALGRPIIAATPIPGLWINSGHGHMGWTLSAGSGELMARLMCDGAEAPSFEFPKALISAPLP